MSDIRIKDLPESISIDNGDYIAIDNESTGTRKYPISDVVSKSEQAKNSADQAKTIAEQASNSSSEAVSASEEAKNIAENALEVAETVSQTAIDSAGAEAGQVPTANGNDGWSWTSPSIEALYDSDDDSVEIIHGLRANPETTFVKNILKMVDDKILFSDQKGSRVSINRISSFIKTSDLYVGDTPSKYWYPQGTCSNGDDSYVIAFVSSVNGNNDRVTLRKYSIAHQLLQSKTVAVNHCNDMTYFDGKIYATGYGGSLSRYTLAVIDYDSLEFIENLTLPRSFSLVDYHDGFFYTSNSHDLVKYDTEFNLVSVVTLSETNVNRTGAHYGLLVTDDYVYIGNGYPNSVERYSLDGELLNIFNVGYINGDYAVGECEGLFYNDNLGGVVLTTGVYPGFLTPSVYTQNFLIDFDKNTYDGISAQHRVYNTYTQLYVDASNTGTNPDGSAEHPYREINEALVNSIGAMTTVRINVNAGEYESISTMSNSQSIQIVGVNKALVSVKGINLTFGGTVHISDLTVKTPAAMNSYNNRALVVAAAKCVLQNVGFDCTDCENAVYSSKSTLIINGVTLSETLSYGINAQYSDVIIGNINYPSAIVPLYLSVCNCVKPSSLPFYNNSINYQWTPCQYMLSNPIGTDGPINLPDWVTTFLTEKKYKKIGLIVKLGDTYRNILYAPSGSGYVGGTLINPSDTTKLYFIQAQIDSQLRINVNGYIDLPNGTWHADASVKIEGIIIE